ncbi:MAG: hypothetical protein MUO54_14215 [Anaerolineales bacterium]|nr:hypothetical protein [Anaerolineales bacterium]
MTQSSTVKAIAQRRKAQFRSLISENTLFPLATITYHGPSPTKATKIIVGILKSKEIEPIIKEWIGEEIAEDVQSAREISLFIQEHEVARVITSEWVLSCPHEEGVDFPEGEDCPFCLDWQK